jgi:N utilization substance protein B
VSDGSGFSGRRAARERALSFLYEAESRDCSVEAILDELPLEVDAFAVDLVSGVESNQATIDTLLTAHAHGWAVGRMPSIDRAILRLAAYELGHRADVPTAVIINEAVDLAKEYSTEKSGGFVNGVLVAVAEELRPDSDRPDDEQSG